MTIYFPYGETVTVLRATYELDPISGEPSGNPDWSNPTSTDYTGCAVGMGPTGEQYNVGFTATDISQTVYMPYEDIDIASTDRVVVRGITYEVLGQPFQWSSPFTGTFAGTEVYLRTVQD